LVKIKMGSERRASNNDEIWYRKYCSAGSKSAQVLRVKLRIHGATLFLGRSLAPTAGFVGSAENATPGRLEAWWIRCDGSLNQLQLGFCRCDSTPTLNGARLINLQDT
jgi:hypothetical protein